MRMRTSFVLSCVLCCFFASPRLGAAVSKPVKKQRRRKLDIISVRSALKETNDNRLEAAKVLGVSRATLYRFLDDIATTRSVIALLLEQPAITSDMIDNTNGLIAVRAFMTDLFFVDQVVLPAR